MYTNGTKKLLDLRNAADIQNCFKIKIYVEIP